MIETAENPRSAISFDGAFFTKDPLFWPIAEAAQTFANHTDWPNVAEYDEHFARPSGVHFTLQPPKSRRKRGPTPREEVSYDRAISTRGVVPTRARNWHDLLNALVWATFPNAKRALHTRQHQAIEKRLETGAKGARSRSEDALALLDEGGILVACEAPYIDAIKNAFTSRDEKEVLRAFSAGIACAAVFGHAIFEGLVLGRPDGWGAALFIPTEGPLPNPPSHTAAYAPSFFLRFLDGWLAQELFNNASFQSPEGMFRADLHLIRPR